MHIFHLDDAHALHPVNPENLSMQTIREYGRFTTVNGRRRCLPHISSLSYCTPPLCRRILAWTGVLVNLTANPKINITDIQKACRAYAYRLTVLCQLESQSGGCCGLLGGGSNGSPSACAGDGTSSADLN
jgi:hypothetical protein